MKKKLRHCVQVFLICLYFFCFGLLVKARSKSSFPACTFVCTCVCMHPFCEFCSFMQNWSRWRKRKVMWCSRRQLETNSLFPSKPQPKPVPIQRKSSSYQVKGAKESWRLLLALKEGDEVKYSPAGDKLIMSIHICTHYYYCNVLVHPARSKEPKGLVHSAGQSFQYVRSDILVEGLNPKTKYLIRTQRCYTGVYSLQKEICGGHATFL